MARFDAAESADQSTDCAVGPSTPNLQLPTPKVNSLEIRSWELGVDGPTADSVPARSVRARGRPRSTPLRETVPRPERSMPATSRSALIASRGAISRRPTAASTPTIRRTIFQRKCEPRTRMRMSGPASAISSPSTCTSVDFTSASSSVNPRKSFMPTKSRGSLPHRADVERLLDPPHERLAERRPAPRDLVDVAARHRVVSRVETVRHFVDGDDVDVGGQLVVQLSPQLLRGCGRVDVEVRDLPDGVHAGVGPPGPIQLEFPRPERLAYRPVDLSLDRAGVLLNLPARVPGACVFDQQLEACHQERRSWSTRTSRRTSARGATRTACTPALLASPGMTMARPAIMPS